jgi:hypothetical protein
MKTGIFVSSTHDVFAGRMYVGDIALYIADIVTSKQTWFNASTICSATPMKERDSLTPNPFSMPEPSKDSAFTFNCTLDNKYQAFSGVYQHPLYGNITLSFNSSAHTMSFNYGIYGVGLMCTTTIDGANTLRLQFSGLLNVLNDPSTSVQLGATATFSVDQNGQTNSLVFNLIEPHLPPTFQKLGGGSTTNAPTTTTTPSSGNSLSTSIFTLALAFMALAPIHGGN